MNPYSNLGKPFLGSWIPANSQSVNYPTNHLTTPIERPKNAAAFKFPDFPTSASSDTSSLARPPPSYESYIHPIKRVRHTPQEYSEVHREVLTLPNQVRNGGRREDQLHTQLQPGSKGLDDSFLPQHGGVRKAQNNLGLGLQESSTFGGGSNSSNPLLMKQQLDKSKKELGLGEMHGQLPFNFQNESLYTPVAHNYELANLLMSSYPNNLQVLNLLQQQLQAKQAMQQLNNYVHLNQLLYGQQDAIKGNSFIRGNQADPNNSLLRIPPLDQQSFLNYITASGGQNGLGSLFRQDKLNMSNGVSDGKKNLVQNSGLEKKEEETYSRLNKKEDLKLEEMSRLGLKAEDQMAADLQGKEPPIVIRDEDDQDILAQRKKNNHLQQRATNMALLVKEQKDRRKNKWQMMLEQEGGVDPENPMKLSPFDKLGKSGKLSRSEKRAADLAAFKPTDIENYEDLQGNLSGGMRLGTSSQRKKKESFSRGNGKMKNSQGKNQSLLESQLYQDDKGMNHFSITSSYGRTMEEVTMDENDQKTIDTRFGDDYQAQIVDLDLGSNNVMYKRVPKLAWDPEMVDGKALEQYFEKLQAILNCKGINEEKAIKMLVKKNMIQDEVIVTIKKNEKFYSSFLGASHADKHVKHKKGR